MLDVVAHSRLGLLHRRAPVIGAENTLTHGGIGLRLLLPVLDGRLPANLEAYVRQLDPTADLIGQSTMVVATMRELAVSFAAAAAVRESGPVSLEVLGYDVDGAPEALALAHPLRADTAGPDRLKVMGIGVPLTGTCTASWWCPLGRTNSLGSIEILRRQLRAEGYADAATVAEDGTLADTALSTLVTLDAAGRLSVVNRRCDDCLDLLALSVLEWIGLPVETSQPQPADRFAALSQGAWLIEPTYGVTQVVAVGDEPVGWTEPGREVNRRLAALRDRPSHKEA